MKIGIMTGGGDCPGLNAVIRAAVKVGIRRHGAEFLGIEDAFNGLIDLDYRSPTGNRWLAAKDVQPILPRGGTILGTSNKSDPFGFVGKDGVERDVSAQVMENYEKLGLEAVISIGGDGSMGIAKRMQDLGMNVVGVPKTIDNDLAATYYTFGFDTAVGVATDALDRIRDTAASHDRVILVEVMGRDAGFIALHAGVAGGAHAILLPEIPYRIEPIVARINDRRDRGMPFSVIVVAEGAKPVGGESSILEHVPGGMARLAGAAQICAAGLEPHLGDTEVRMTVLGHVQRGGSPSNFDRVLATRFGHHAADLVAEKRFGRMVALRTPDIVSVTLEEALGAPKRVDPAGQLVETARALGVAFGDE
ncbi:MAG: 6-phosphofructokinase [Deltaproteobacteria bacterium]|nr:6-phosphofructokinase [Deltaproteobacteria bacterium]